jgi:uncharacterized membrane protein YvbJ
MSNNNSTVENKSKNDKKSIKEQVIDGIMLLLMIIVVQYFLDRFYYQPKYQVMLQEAVEQNSNKIAVVNLPELVMSSGIEDNEELLRKIDSVTEKLSQQGYVVLRAESLYQRDKSREIKVSIVE